MRLFLTLCAAATLGALTTDLKSSFPARGDLLEDAPLKVALVFTDPVEAESTRIMILHRDTTDFFRLNPGLTDRRDSVEAVVPRKLLGGHYLIRWSAVARNGQHFGGLIPFAVDVPE